MTLQECQRQYDSMDKYTSTYEDKYGDMLEEDANWYNECNREHLELMEDIKCNT